MTDRRRRELVHGTDAGYKRGCTCADCRHAHVVYNGQTWRRRKRERDQERAEESGTVDSLLRLAERAR